MSNYDLNKEKFEKFHDENPRIWGLLKRFSLEAKNSGMTKIGIALLFERIRWEVQVVTRAKDGFKLNNNHKAFYARMLMDECPEFAGFFETREQITKRQILKP